MTRYILTSLLAMLLFVNAAAQDGEQKSSKKEIIKTGYNFGPLPVVAFDADRAFKWVRFSISMTLAMARCIPTLASSGISRLRSSLRARSSIPYRTIIDS